LQMLALVTMEPPKENTAGAIRRERARVLAALHMSTDGPVSRYSVRGQYEGYTKEKDVAEGSGTETSFEVKAFIRNSRWKGVPLYLRSVKAHVESKTEIKIFFKSAPHYLCEVAAKTCPHQNVLIFRIQPDEGIVLCFWAKKPGLSTGLEEKDLSFLYGASALRVRLPDAYERLLSDALLGDQTLFASTDEVRAAWRFTMTILRAWEHEPLSVYKKGTEGSRLHG